METLSKTERRWQKQLKRKRESGMTYESRAHNLKFLGFESYGAYLKSPLWNKVRCRVYAIKGRQCWLCERDATEIHHNRYRVSDLTGKTLDNLFPICSECHEAIEYDKKGKKSEVNTARGRFIERRRQKEAATTKKEIVYLTFLMTEYGVDVDLTSAML